MNVRDVPDISTSNLMEDSLVVLKSLVDGVGLISGCPDFRGGWLQYWSIGFCVTVAIPNCIKIPPLARDSITNSIISE